MCACVRGVGSRSPARSPLVCHGRCTRAPVPRRRRRRDLALGPAFAPEHLPRPDGLRTHAELLLV
jgi:hypothetical protein